jgi:sulfate permease, SulP family
VLVLLSTFVLTVLVDLTVAMQAGIVLSALLFMRAWPPPARPAT